MTKRVYSPGFYVEKKNKIQSQKQNESPTSTASIIVPNNDLSNIEKAAFNKADFEKSIFPKINDSISSAVTSGKICINEPVSFCKNKHGLNSPVISNLKKSHQLIKKSKQPETGKNTTSKVMATLGGVFLLIGLVLLLWVSILIGAILMGLGSIFFIVSLATSGKGGGNSETGGNNNTASEYQDVVYLKNGGIVRGMIIEQVPNVQLKIQTKDGNVFVYKMDEIGKITKELSK